MTLKRHQLHRSVFSPSAKLPGARAGATLRPIARGPFQLTFRLARDVEATVGGAARLRRRTGLKERKARHPSVTSVTPCAVAASPTSPAPASASKVAASISSPASPSALPASEGGTFISPPHPPAR